MSEGLWGNLKGLMTRQALGRLQRDVEKNWTEEQRMNVSLEPDDLKITLSRKVHFLKMAGMLPTFK